MKVQEILKDAQDTLTVKRVFGEPFEKDGVTIIPAANISGGGGGGAGPDESGGGGFGLNARPSGAYVIKNGDVTWQPAIDINRVILGGQLVAIAGLLTLRTFIRKRRRGRR
jgi:uncharacterized spore protein YtfJ